MKGGKMMNKPCQAIITVFCGAFLLLGAHLAAVGATVTLQEGLDGYYGCADTYIATGGYLENVDDNFGDSDIVFFNSEQYRGN